MSLEEEKRLLFIKKIPPPPPPAHGGAWKVAYADFVTGMMSLFLVLWILSQDEEVIIATSATVEGQTTAHYIEDTIKNDKIKVTKLAQGLPVGGEIEQLDDGLSLIHI